MNKEEFKKLYEVTLDPWLFMSEFMFTQDPVKGELSFPHYDYLKTLVEHAHRERYLLVPKSRQMTVTWTMIGYFLWRAVYHQPGLYLFLSRNERCAEELLDRARFVLDHLPGFLQPERATDSQSELSFVFKGSRIISLPATPDGTRMYAPTGVFWDEMAFTPYDDSIWSALKPALDSGGKFAGVSSSGGAMNLFAKLAGGKSKTEQTEINPVHILAPFKFKENLSFEFMQEDQKEDSGEQKPDKPKRKKPLFFIYSIHYSCHPDKQSESWREEAAAGLSEARWQREQQISFTAEHDLVYSEFSPQRHLLAYDYKPQKDLEIFRAIDFGYRNPAVLWIQKDAKGDYIVFDEWAELDRTTDQLYEALTLTDFYHGISERNVKWTACDPAGDAAQDSGLSPVAVLRNKGLKIRYRPSRIATGIELVKAKLLDARHESRLRISPRCKRLIADFQRYQWGARGEEPIKDGISDHTMDALRYFFVNLEQQETYVPSPMLKGVKKAG